jgi:hypothetical protein
MTPRLYTVRKKNLGVRSYTVEKEFKFKSLSTDVTKESQ